MRFSRSELNPVLVVFASVVTRSLEVATRARRALKGYATVGRFGGHGDAFVFDPDGVYSYESIFVGDHVNLGTAPLMLATWATIQIGDHVVFGPGVTIRGGNHRTDILGRNTDSVGDDEKRPEDDLGVVIEDDVWVGGNARILHGVTIGRGSIIGASAIVTRSVPPYSIVVGNPARVVRSRWEPEQIAEREARLRGFADQ